MIKFACIIVNKKEKKKKITMMINKAKFPVIEIATFRYAIFVS